MLYTRQRRAEVGLLPIDGGFVPRRDNPVAGLLGTAWAHFDHTSIVGSNPVTEWQDIRGTAARDLDVVVGTGANLITLESGVALLTGTAGDFLSTPDTPGNSGTGDKDVRIRVALADYTPAATDILIAKDTTVATHRSWQVFIRTDGTLNFAYSNDGSDFTGRTAKSTVAVGAVDGTTIWLRATYQTSTGKVNFFKSTENVNDSEDVVTWTPIGTEVTITSGTIADTDALVAVGAFSNGVANPTEGKFYRAQVYDVIGGSTETVDFDPTKATVNSATFTSGGVVWTANGDAFVNATSHTGIYSRGSVGLETTAGQTIASPVTVFAVFKPTLAAPGAGQFIFDSKSGAGTAQFLQTIDADDDKYAYNQGTNISISQAYDANLRVFTAQGNGDATSKLTVSDVGSVTGDTGSEDWNFGSVLMDLSGANTMPGLFLEFLVFDRALSAGEISLVQAHLAAKFT